MDAQYLALLEKALQNDFVQHLPPLIDAKKSPEERAKKNQSRAFSAFALSSICGISASEAAGAIVDDFEDQGIDAIYLCSSDDTLYLVQGKLKKAAQFKQDEALAFCQGVRKLINQDLDSFNKHVQDRRLEIEDAIADCSRIRLIVAHIGEGISEHAQAAISELLAAKDIDEERFDKTYEDFNAQKVFDALYSSKAAKKIDAIVTLHQSRKVETPRVTYFGLVSLDDLVDLHRANGATLYERNIRSFLGKTTPINKAIRETLATQPEMFMYLNNGVTMLADTIDPKDSPNGRKRLKLRGISVVNGAQTIATSAKFKEETKNSYISQARVLLTIIKADTNGQFGKEVTRARNHQNPVETWNFAALDDEQERLRRELAYLGLHYAYKAAAFEGPPDQSRIHIAEAAQALALLHSDPRFIVWLKKEPANLLDTSKSQYNALFGNGLTGLKLANAVYVSRYILTRMSEEEWRSSSFDRLVCMHGKFAMAWTLSKRTRNVIEGRQVIDNAKLKMELSKPFDDLRQILQDEAKKCPRGPLAVFRNQGEALPVLQETAIKAYGLTGDPAVEHKKKQQNFGQFYPADLFNYLVSKAPQIGNLA